MAELTPMQQDFLKEMTNIGVGNAATSLAKMVHCPVDITLPQVEIVPIDNVFTGQSAQVCATTCGIEGVLTGNVTIVFTDNSSFWLVDKMYGNKEGTTTEFTQEGTEALKEFCNIIGGAFLTALSNLTKLDFMPQIPSIIYGKGQEILQQYTEQLQAVPPDILSVRAQLSIDGKDIDGDIYLVLDEKSFKALFDKMLG